MTNTNHQISITRWLMPRKYWSTLRDKEPGPIPDHQEEPHNQAGHPGDIEDLIDLGRFFDKSEKDMDCSAPEQPLDQENQRGQPDQRVIISFRGEQRQKGGRRRDPTQQGDGQI